MATILVDTQMLTLYISGCGNKKAILPAPCLHELNESDPGISGSRDQASFKGTRATNMHSCISVLGTYFSGTHTRRCAAIPSLVPEIYPFASHLILLAKKTVKDAIMSRVLFKLHVELFSLSRTGLFQKYLMLNWSTRGTLLSMLRCRNPNKFILNCIPTLHFDSLVGKSSC